ncbi:MAG: transglutaminase domain-containing protein [Ferruginibacter sp.]
MHEFAAADSLAMTVKYDHDIVKLSKDLTSIFTDNKLKVRAIFRWITENIAYDYKFINKGREVKKPDCDNAVNCEQRIAEWKGEYVKKVLQTKKGVCSGYAELFKTLCDIAGIKTEVVEGYARTKPYQVGNHISVNHAWNAVLLDSNWYFLDATWAAGACSESEETEKLTGFHKNFKAYYWLTPYEQLKRNHYPQHGRWNAGNNFTKQQFFNQPYYAEDIIADIQLIKPAAGMLEIEKGDTIHIEFEYSHAVTKIQVNSNVFRNPDLWYKEQAGKHKFIMVRDTAADRRQVYIPFTQNGSRYSFDYVVKDASLYYMDILFDHKRAMRFRVKLKHPYSE